MAKLAALRGVAVCWRPMTSKEFLTNWLEFLSGEVNTTRTDDDQQRLEAISTVVANLLAIRRAGAGQPES